MTVLRWTALAVGAMLLAVAVVWVVGSRLPVEHRATVSRRIAADAEVVWNRVRRVEDWPAWQEMTVDVLAEDSIRVRQAGETLVYRLHHPAPRTLVTEIATPGLPFGGRWTWSVEPDAEGSAVVTIVEDGEVYDPFFRFFSRFVFGHDGSIRSAMDALEASFHGPGGGAATAP